VKHSPIGSDLQNFLDDIWIEARQEGAHAVEAVAFAASRARLATRIHAARRARGLTQAQLARKSGIDQSEISRIEAGQSNPTLKTLSFLAYVLGCEITFDPSPGKFARNN
jgi:ribosome-binding protein aMBF1 (putative translation factor)